MASSVGDRDAVFADLRGGALDDSLAVSHRTSPFNL